MSEEYENPKVDEVDDYEEVPQVTPGRKKRTFSSIARQNIIDNLAKGRAKRLENLKAKREAKEKEKKEADRYDNYYVNENGVSNEYEEDSDSEYEYVYEDGTPAPPPTPKPRQPKQPAQPKQPVESNPLKTKQPVEEPMSKKERSLLERMEKQEEILMKILNSQQERVAVRKVKKKAARPRPVQTIQVQVPKQTHATVKKTTGDSNMNYLMSLFN